MLRNEGSETYVEITINVIKGKGQIIDLAFFNGYKLLGKDFQLTFYKIDSF